MNSATTKTLSPIVSLTPGTIQQSTASATIPEGLDVFLNQRCWCLYKPGSKIPVNAAGIPIGVDNPANLYTGEEVEGHAEATGYGLGLVVTEGRAFLDIDDGLLPDGKTWKPHVSELIAMFPDAYMETSSSGRGIHILFSAKSIPLNHANKNTDLKIELYTEAYTRYFAITGTHARGRIEADYTDNLLQVVDRYFMRGAGTLSAPADPKRTWTVSPQPGARPPATLEEAAEIARKSNATAALRNRPTGYDWWHNRWEGFYKSASEGRLPLMGLCLFIMGGNCESALELFKMSEQMREKVDGRDTLLRDEMLKAWQSYQGNFYGSDMASTPEEAAQYAAEGAGFIYIYELDKVHGPDGRLYGQVQFDNEFSNRKFYAKHIGRKTKHSAWDYFVRDPDYGRTEVTGLRFRPDLPPLTIYVDPSDGRTYFNDYEPLPVRSLPGDASPFLNHIVRLFPNRDDAEIVLAFMAHAVQFPGIKPTWAITLIGAQGNGKSLLFDVIAEAVGRQYGYKPRAGELDSRFNAYAEHNLILCIEEVRLRWKPEILDILKPLISDGWIEIQGKGRDQITARNFSHVMLCSNHLDAVNKNTGDRRFCVLVTKQKTPDDINRDGMGGDYFKRLYHWLESENGYAICAHYLKNYKIPDSLDFKGRAPITSTTQAAIEASLSDAATTLRDAVAASEKGFRGGFIEARAATTRLQKAGLWGGPRKFAETLDALEYYLHPRLSGGDGQIRCNNERMRLYVKRGSSAEQLQTHEEIKSAFKQANPGYTTSDFVRAVK